MSQQDHERAEQFLRDQEALYEEKIPQAQFEDRRLGFAKILEGPNPQIFEPVVMTKRERIVFSGPGIRIDSFVKLEGGLGLTIGAGVHIASFAHVGIGGGQTLLGEYSCVASGAKIISGSNSPFAMSMSASAPKELQSVAQSLTVLRPYAAVLVNAVVLPGVTLEEGAVLAASSVARRDIPAWEIWGGTPARFLKRRRDVLCCAHGTARHGNGQCGECSMLVYREYRHELALGIL